MKVGIIGGTFDPIHISHINIAKQAKVQFHLDEVWFMLSPNPPHKDSEMITSFKDRYTMLNLALKQYPCFYASDYEEKNKFSYTADTLTKLKQDIPENEFYFIIGSDSLINIDSWYHPETILKNAVILTAKREDSSFHKIVDKISDLKEKYNASIYLIDILATGISSSDIRNNIEAHKDEIPEEALSYIAEHNLYSNAARKKRMNPDEILCDLKNILNEHRYNHTVGVANTAKALAQSLGENPNKAYLAGILHDCAKCMPDEENLRLCRKYNVKVSQTELSNQFLLHAKAGALVAENKYGITDKDVLSSVKYHTTGKPAMTLLEKIVFTADYIEPLRNHAKNLDYLRKIAYTDIDLTVYTILRDTLDYLRGKNGDDNIDSNTVEAFEYYKKLMEKRNHGN